jgi:hypothetical protein
MKISLKNILLFVTFLIFIFTVFSYFYKKKNEKEAFFPRIKQIYRPHLRNTRIYSSKQYNKFQNWLNKVLRNIGIL